jgi:S1-C subfamily serine protease
MSESDQTGNPEERDPTQTTPVEPAAPAAPWPQYTWPPTAEGAPEATSPGSADATDDEPATVPVWASWPPTQPTPAASGPYAPDPYAPDPYAPAPAPNPYPYDPNAGYGGVWGPAPPVSGWSPVAPPPAPRTPPTAAKARRGLSVLATLALVLASAGVGAGVAIALHRNSDTRTFDTAGNNSNPPSANNGLGGNGGGFGNGNTGTTSPGTGALDVNAIAAKVNPALVNINTTLAQGRAAGTGMLISSTGEILTNNHVIAEATSIKVTPGGTGPSYTAKVIGYDVTEDVALLQITDRVSNLPTVTFGEPSKVQIGDPVVAIGNALGQGGTPKATQGRVTALDQQVTAGDSAGTQETLVGMIQINAPIQPGDSGGALVDRNARVIGMNTAAAGGGRFNPQVGSSIGFAIPVDNAVSIVSQIRTGTDTDKVHIGDRALIGVQVQDINGQTAPVASGALVVGVQDNTGASAAGMKTGDVLVSVDGKPIANSAALRLILVKLHPGDSVSVGWVDSTGTRHDASIKLVVGPPL